MSLKIKYIEDKNSPNSLIVHPSILKDSQIPTVEIHDLGLTVGKVKIIDNSYLSPELVVATSKELFNAFRICKNCKHAIKVEKGRLDEHLRCEKILDSIDIKCSDHLLPWDNDFCINISFVSVRDDFSCKLFEGED